MYTLKRVLYKYTSMILLRERRVTEQQFLATDLSPTSLDKGTTDEETLQRFEKKDSLFQKNDSSFTSRHFDERCVERLRNGTNRKITRN